MRGKSDDRGAVLVEAAFVMPVLIIIVFGIIEVGMLYRAGSVVSAATRSGARTAAQTYAVSMNDSNVASRTAKQDATVDVIRLAVEKDLQNRGGTDTPTALWVYRANTVGFPGALTDFTACTGNCYRYTWNAGTGHFTFDATSPKWSQPDACGVTVDSIGVFVRMSHTAVVAPLSLPRNSVPEYTVMRLEPRNDCLSVEGPA